MSTDAAVECPPLPRNWPALVNRALVYVCSLLKTALDNELGRRMDSPLYPTREAAGQHRRNRKIQQDAEARAAAARGDTIQARSDAR
jgi:hypothetical protein